MTQIAFYDTKPYDTQWFDALNKEFEFRYIKQRLDEDTANLARGCAAVVAFVNDRLDARTLTALKDAGVRAVCMRCAGFNNVDLAAAEGLGIPVTTVPGYSPHAVAEHAMALALTLNRNLHRAYQRTREFNFSLTGLTGFDLYGKTAGVVGTGRIGRAFAQIAEGFGMRVLGYDLYPTDEARATYVPIDDLLAQSDIVSLHCPLTEESRHMIGADAFHRMKQDALLVNTSRGALVDSRALLHALKHGGIRGAALDVYEEEAGVFFEDASDQSDRDDVLSLLLTLPNVVVTSHQGFLTHEALRAIAESVLNSLSKVLAKEAVPV